jgi:2-methylfumaryl-CoA isomerase
LTPLIEKAVATRSYDDLRAAFDAHDVCWGPYRTLLETVSEEHGLVKGNPVFAVIDNPSGHSYPVPGSAATLPGKLRGTPIRAPQLGEHTDEILGEILGFSAGTIGRLHDQGIVASAPSNVETS